MKSADVAGDRKLDFREDRIREEFSMLNGLGLPTAMPENDH